MDVMQWNAYDLYIQIECPSGGKFPMSCYSTQTPMQILILRPPSIAHACAR